MCKSIHFHYIDSYYGRRDTDFLFVVCPGRETCWSWSPTLLQLRSRQRPLRNLQTHKEKYSQHNYLSVQKPTDSDGRHQLKSHTPCLVDWSSYKTSDREEWYIGG